MPIDGMVEPEYTLYILVFQVSDGSFDDQASRDRDIYRPTKVLTNAHLGCLCLLVESSPERRTSHCQDFCRCLSQAMRGFLHPNSWIGRPHLSLGSSGRRVIFHIDL